MGVRIDVCRDTGRYLVYPENPGLKPHSETFMYIERTPHPNDRLPSISRTLYGSSAKPLRGLGSRPPAALPERGRPAAMGAFGARPCGLGGARAEMAPGGGGRADSWTASSGDGNPPSGAPRATGEGGGERWEWGEGRGRREEGAGAGERRRTGTEGEKSATTHHGSPGCSTIRSTILMSPTTAKESVAT